MSTPRKFLIVASAFGLTGVALGAFGAHSLKSSVPAELLSAFETGVRYQMYHTFALFVAAWALQVRKSRKFEVAGWLFLAGVLLFSGSLYALALTGLRSFGFITPLGGLSLLGGWLALAWGFWEKESVT